MEFVGLGVALCIALAAVTLIALVTHNLGLGVTVITVARRSS
jgi:hypothetical protein